MNGFPERQIFMQDGLDGFQIILAYGCNYRIHVLPCFRYE